MKVTKVTGRGTGKREADVSSQNWAGDEYRKAQQERLAKIGKNITLSLGRGDRTMALKDLPAPHGHDHPRKEWCASQTEEPVPEKAQTRETSPFSYF